MRDLLRQLAGGDRRSIGKANHVVRRVLLSPDRFTEIVGGLSHEDPLIRMRCADVAEKISRARPEWLAAHKLELLELAKQLTEKELRWHIAQMLPRLRLTPAQRRAAVALMFEYLKDESRIVKTCAMQALVDFAAGDTKLGLSLIPLIRALCTTGTPAVRSRARKLIAHLGEKSLLKSE